ncbi:MAG: hypothetical protein QOJ31_160 [Gaiellales bacterium]|nr:hypothetical protein [Gaiellales bacterium]
MSARFLGWLRRPVAAVADVQREAADAEYLDGLDGVAPAWREDREFILVETAGPIDEQRQRIDAHATAFLYGAIAGCA